MHPAEAQAPRRHNSHVSELHLRDAALVLSGGGINGVLLELGFLKRLRETPFWDRVGWIYGTSAGRRRRDDGRPRQARGARVVPARAAGRRRVPSAARVAAPARRTRTTTRCPPRSPSISAGRRSSDPRWPRQTSSSSCSQRMSASTSSPTRRATSSSCTRARSTPPETMGRAILASAAVSALVLPVRVDDVIATDGGWVRNFPLEHAELNPAVHAVIAFRYLAGYRPTDIAFLGRVRERLDAFAPFRRSAPYWKRSGSPRSVRSAESQPTTRSSSSGSCVSRSRRNTVLEERILERPRRVGSRPSTAFVTRSSTPLSHAAPPWRRRRCGRISKRSSPKPTSRSATTAPVDRIIVRATPGDDGLEPTYRGAVGDGDQAGLIERGYRLTDDDARPERVMAGSPMKRSAGVRAGAADPVPMKAGPGDAGACAASPGGKRAAARA